MKQNISLLELKKTVGFIYWVNETHDLNFRKKKGKETFLK